MASRTWFLGAIVGLSVVSLLAIPFSWSVQSPRLVAHHSVSRGSFCRPALSVIGPYLAGSGSTGLLQAVASISGGGEIGFEPLGAVPTGQDVPSVEKLHGLMLALLNVTREELEAVISDPSKAAPVEPGRCGVGLCAVGPTLDAVGIKVWADRVRAAGNAVGASFNAVAAGSCPRLLVFKIPAIPEIVNGLLAMEACARPEMASLSSPVCSNRVARFMEAVTVASVDPGLTALQRGALPRPMVFVVPVRDAFRQAVSSFRYLHEGKGQFAVREAVEHGDKSKVSQLLAASKPDPEVFLVHLETYLSALRGRDDILQSINMPLVYAPYHGLQSQVAQLARQILGAAHHGSWNAEEMADFAQFRKSFLKSDKGTRSDICSALANYQAICEAVHATGKPAVIHSLPGPCDMCGASWPW